MASRLGALAKMGQFIHEFMCTQMMSMQGVDEDIHPDAPHVPRVPQVVTSKSGVKYSQPLKSACHMLLPETQCAMQAFSQLRAHPEVCNQSWHTAAHTCARSAVRLRRVMLLYCCMPGLKGRPQGLRVAAKMLAWRTAFHAVTYGTHSSAAGCI